MSKKALYLSYNLLYLTASRAKYKLTILGSKVNGKSTCVEHALRAEYLDIISNKLAGALTDYLSQLVEQECKDNGIAPKTLFFMFGVKDMDGFLEKSLGVPIK